MADSLEAAARRAAAYAYCPYSRFRVGAALEAEDGTVFVGCNVENAAYSPCLCAERAALGTAVAAGHRKFTRISVVGGHAKAASPCGVCRQALFEFSPGMEVRCSTLEEGGDSQTWVLRDLLPDGFGPSDLDVPPPGESGD